MGQAFEKKMKKLKELETKNERKNEKRGENWNKNYLLCKGLFFFKLKENWVLSEISYLGISISILAWEMIGFVFWEGYPYPFFY